jgi:hypothetical protein
MLSGRNPFKHQQISRRFDDLDAADPQRLICLPKSEKRTGEIEQRSRILQLNINSKIRMIPPEWQPRHTRRKTVLRGLSLPRHRRSRAVPAQGQRPVGDGFRVLQLIKWNINLWQAKFFALPNDNITPQTDKKQHRHPPEIFSCLGACPTADPTRRIMI